jgi:GAF domain-containing protein
LVPLPGGIGLCRGRQRRRKDGRDREKALIMAGQELLACQVSEFAQTLARGATISDLLGDCAERATAVLGVAGAGVSVLESGQFRFVAATDDRFADLERVQEAVQAGPCADACQTGKIVTVGDLAESSPGWGRYEQAARDAGIVAVAAIPMRGGENIGALDLFSTVRRDWRPEDLGAAVILADMATGYLIAARELEELRRVNEQLREALDSRIVIEQAKGVLAAERNISVDQAFEVLRRHARSHSVSLRSVAQAVVSLGLRP